MFARFLLTGCCLLLLSACSGSKNYRDTSELEMPPRLPISQREDVVNPVSEPEKTKTDLAEVVNIDDEDNPTVLKIEKLFERAWDMVGQGLDKRKIEITDRNRDLGVYYVKYDASVDTGSRLFGNVKIFIFEDEYAEAEYKLSVAWHETATEVRAEMMPKDEETEDSDEAKADGSPKLLKALYEALTEEQDD